MTNVGRFTLSSRTVAEMTLTLSQSLDHPSPGNQVTYTLVYNNAGDGSSTSTIITASAPANTSYVTGSTTLNSASKD